MEEHTFKYNFEESVIFQNLKAKLDNFIYNKCEYNWIRFSLCENGLYWNVVCDGPEMEEDYAFGGIQIDNSGQFIVFEFMVLEVTHLESELAYSYATDDLNEAILRFVERIKKFQKYTKQQCLLAQEEAKNSKRSNQ